MNKPYNIKNILEVDKDYCDKLIQFFDNSYTEIHSNLYNRSNFFKNVDCNFIVNRFKVENKKKLNQFINNSDKLLNKLHDLYGPGEFWNFQVAKMNGGGKILPHVDDGLYFVFSHRIHIPLITNENVIFRIEDKEFYLSVGKIYEINNLKEHSVENNNSNFYRLHLILDYVSSEYIPFMSPKQNYNNIKYK
jgi:hypothetical protein